MKMKMTLKRKRLIDALNKALGVVRRGDIHEHHQRFDDTCNAIEAAIHELGGKPDANPDEVG